MSNQDEYGPPSRGLSNLQNSINGIEIRLARIEERIGPVIKVVYGIVTMGMTAIAAALIALVVKK